LLQEGAKVKAYDPEAMNHFKELFPEISYAQSGSEVLAADAVLIVTEWKEFESLDYRGKLVIDGRRVEKARTEAEIYEGMCW
jgi:UDPglucose 6-dehydrogenase